MGYIEAQSVVIRDFPKPYATSRFLKSCDQSLLIAPLLDLTSVHTFKKQPSIHLFCVIFLFLSSIEIRGANIDTNLRKHNNSHRYYTIGWHFLCPE